LIAKTWALSLKSTISKRWVTLISVMLLVLGIAFVTAGLLKALIAPSVKSGDTVRIDYTLVLDDRLVYYTTVESEPAVYTLGQEQLLPGFEDALMGMRVGEKKTITIAPEDAYGPYRRELVLTLNRSDLPEGSQPVVGQEILTESEGGSPIVLVITEVTETTVTLDANHPLSGHHLTFEIQLVGIEDDPAPSQRTN